MTYAFEIASTANPRVKAAVRLRDRREREQTGLTIVDGAREIRRALDAGVDMVEAFVHEPTATGDDAAAALKGLMRLGGWTTVAPTVIERLSFGDRSDGIVLIVRTPRRTLDEMPLPADAFLAVVDRVEKPGNLGAILRSADGAGVAAVIATDSRTDVWNPAAIRASLGTIFSLPVVPASAAEAVAWLEQKAFRIVTSRVDAQTNYADADLTGNLAIVLGSEAAGLGDAWTGAGIESVRIPMLGIADSLNVSATAAILFYEAVRQRTTAREGG